MSKEELIGHARAIKDFCMECKYCEGCPFYKAGNKCKLTDLDDCPTRWDLPEVRVSEGHYQYRVLDDKGNNVSGMILHRGTAYEIYNRLKKQNPKRKYEFQKRLVMCWENVEDGEE